MILRLSLEHHEVELCDFDVDFDVDFGGGFNNCYFKILYIHGRQGMNANNFADFSFRTTSRLTFIGF